MNPKCLLQIEENIWIEFWYELFIYYIFIDYIATFCLFFNGAKYSNTILLKIPHLTIWHVIFSQIVSLEPFLHSYHTIRIEFWYELFICYVFIDNIGIFLFFWSKLTIRIRSYYKLRICHVLWSHTVRSDYCLQTYHSVWIECLFEIYICGVFVDRVIHSKSSLRTKQNIRMEPW
jgi:hypothetical protein